MAWGTEDERQGHLQGPSKTSSRAGTTARFTVTPMVEKGGVGRLETKPPRRVSRKTNLKACLLRQPRNITRGIACGCRTRLVAERHQNPEPQAGPAPFYWQFTAQSCATLVATWSHAGDTLSMLVPTFLGASICLAYSFPSF